MNVSKIAKISIYVGEWNHVDREKKSPANTDDTSKIDATKSDLTQEESHLLVKIQFVKSIWVGILELASTS